MMAVLPALREKGCGRTLGCLSEALAGIFPMLLSRFVRRTSIRIPTVLALLILIGFSSLTGLSSLTGFSSLTAQTAPSSPIPPKPRRSWTRVWGNAEYLSGEPGFIESHPSRPSGTPGQELGKNQTAPSPKSLRFPLLLRRDEFLQKMVSKEKYLLGVVQTVNEEMQIRNSEGIRLENLGIRDVVSPQEILSEQVNGELESVVGLLDEITALERKAKKKADLLALANLSELKMQVQAILQSADVSQTLLPLLSDSASGSASSPSVVSPKPDSSRSEAELADLYEQWKMNRVLDFNVKLTKYEVLRTRLLKTAKPNQERRMLQKDLRRALETYQSGDFMTARIQLRDVLNTYPRNTLLDDVTYYCAESSYALNHLDEARDVYTRLLAEYPDSKYAAKALMKLIFIAYTVDEYDKLPGLYARLETVRRNLDADSFGAVSYLLGYAQFKTGRYSEALESLIQVQPQDPYFYPALYLSGACYSNLGKNDLAFAVYEQLADIRTVESRDNPVAEQIRANALLKLGLIHYERGELALATQYFNRVPQSTSNYDLSALGRAWSAYKSGKPGEALKSLETILQNSMVSAYTYEARVLAASSKELMGHSEEAIDDYKQMVEIGARSNRVSEEELSVSGNGPDSEAVETEVFGQLDRIRRFLTGSSASMNPPSASSDRNGKSIAKAAETITQTIDQLDRMESTARQSNRDSLVGDIRQLRSDLMQTLDDHAGSLTRTPSLGGSDPLIQRMGMSEYLKYQFSTLLDLTVLEKAQTRQDMTENARLLDIAKKQGRFESAIQMEIMGDDLEDYFNHLNQYEIYLRENSPEEFTVELDRWATFSGYGISNINFSRIQECDSRMSQISRTVDTLDRVFTSKRKDLDNRIQGLLSDVSVIEKKMKNEAERRENAQRDRFFKTDYFDKQQAEKGVGTLEEKPTSPSKTGKGVK
jgi:TolA-binding protein